MKDIIYVESQTFASIKDYSVRLRNNQTKEESFIPLDSISVVLFTHQNSYFSNKFISTCLEHNILVIFCNNKHSPIAMVSNDFGYIQKYKRLQSQLAFQKRNKDRIWKKIVTYKVRNQFICLRNVNKHGEEDMDAYLESITTSNADAKEAQVARYYFRSLFGPTFKRGRYSDLINRILNYSYAVIRSYIRQQLVMRGLEVSLGIHHYSSENPFNLSDDIIEPFRPIADQYVYESVIEPGYKDFTPDLNKILTQVLYVNCVVDKQSFLLGDAISKVVDSYIACLDHDQSQHFLCPEIVEGGS